MSLRFLSQWDQRGEASSVWRWEWAGLPVRLVNNSHDNIFFFFLKKAQIKIRFFFFNGTTTSSNTVCLARYWMDLQRSKVILMNTLIWLVGAGGVFLVASVTHSQTEPTLPTPWRLAAPRANWNTQSRFPLPDSACDLNSSSTAPRRSIGPVWLSGGRVFPSAAGERSCSLYFPMFHLARSLFGPFFLSLLFCILFFFKSCVSSQDGCRRIGKLSCRTLHPSRGFGGECTKQSLMYVFRRGGGCETQYERRVGIVVD